MSLGKIMNGLHIKSSKVDDSNDAEQVGESCARIAWIIARIRVHVCCILAHAIARKGYMTVRLPQQT